MRTELDEIWSSFMEHVEKYSAMSAEDKRVVISSAACMFQYGKGLEFAITHIGAARKGCGNGQ